MVNRCHLDIAMLRHGINDLRLFYENDARFLKKLKWREANPPHAIFVSISENRRRHFVR